MQTILSISVIICGYTENRLSFLIDAVKSVQRQTIPVDEIIIVVDHNPILMERAKEQLMDVVIVENKEPQGLSGARNCGIALAKGQIIAFLDDDAVATPDWLQCLSEGFVDPLVLGIGGAVAPEWVNQSASWFPEEFLWVVGCTYRGMPQDNGRIRNPIGANMAFRREVFERVGGFRSEIGRIGTRPVGCEETELCIRASQHWREGYFLYKPDAWVKHRVPTQRLTWRYFCTRCYFEGFSKAFVAKYVGTQKGLASERAYILVALPTGVLRGLRDFFCKRDFSGIGRSAFIIVGLMITMIGYLVGIVQIRCTGHHSVEKIPSLSNVV